MDASRAIDHLQKLRAQADVPPELQLKLDRTTWVAQIKAVIARSMGRDHELLEQISHVRFGLSMWTDGTPEYLWDEAARDGINEVISLTDAAIFELQLSIEDSEPVDAASFDPQLWAHVRSLVERGEWSKVAAQVVIFVEDKVRTWGGADRGMVGKGLYASVLTEKGTLPTGAPGGEQEGWRALGMGLAQAVGNVDRHRIQERADAQRYAVGVLGLGSLLLTQLRFEHPDLTD